MILLPRETRRLAASDCELGSVLMAKPDQPYLVAEESGSKVAILLAGQRRCRFWAATAVRGYVVANGQALRLADVNGATSQLDSYLGCALIDAEGSGIVVAKMAQDEFGRVDKLLDLRTWAVREWVNPEVDSFAHWRLVQLRDQGPPIVVANDRGDVIPIPWN